MVPAQSRPLQPGRYRMSNENFIREIDEELRSDRMRALWRRGGPYIIGAAVAVVLAVAANEGWKWWQSSTAANASDSFYAAMQLAEAGDIDAARTALSEVQAQGVNGYPVLAQFRQASLLLQQGDTAGAVAAYDALATAQNNPRLREVALVMAAFVLVDGGDVAAVEQRVAGLTADGAPMRNPAREAIGLTRYRAGDLDGALTAFQEVLDDPGASQETRTRLQLYVAQLVAQGATPPAPTLDDMTDLPEDGSLPAGEIDVVAPEAEAPSGADPAEAEPAQ